MVKMFFIDKSKMNRSNLPLWIAFGLYLLISIIFLFVHAPWRDEAQTYLLCRDLGYLKMMRYALQQNWSLVWMTLIYPFAHLGAPIYVQNVLSVVILSITVYLLLFKSTLPVLARLAVVFSPLFVYFYPNIAGSYCLVPLSLLLLAKNFARRFEKPVVYGLILALLFHSSFELWPMATSCTIWFLVELFMRNDYKKIFGGFIPLLGFTSICFQNAASDIIILPPKMLDVHLNAVQLMGEIGGYSKNDTYALMVVIALTLVMNIIYAKDRQSTFVGSIIYIASVGFSAYYGYQYNLIRNHDQFVIASVLVLVWLIWINGDSLDKSDVVSMNAYYSGIGVLMILCVVLDAGCMKFALDEFNRPYSEGRNAAEFINENVEEDAILLSYNPYYDRAIIPFLKGGRKTLTDVQTGLEYSFVDEKAKSSVDVYSQEYVDSAIAKVNAAKETGKPVYVIMQHANYLYDLEEADWVDAVKLYDCENNVRITCENFAIYKVN